MVETHLKRGRSITGLQMLNLYGIIDHYGAIKKLRIKLKRQRMKIVTKMVPFTSRYGFKNHYGKYSLSIKK